jgi:hypothetical protein
VVVATWLAWKELNLQPAPRKTTALTMEPHASRIRPAFAITRRRLARLTVRSEGFEPSSGRFKVCCVTVDTTTSENGVGFAFESHAHKTISSHKPIVALTE